MSPVLLVVHHRRGVRIGLPVHDLAEHRPRRPRRTAPTRPPVELGVKFRSSVGRLRHRHPVLQGQPRTPARTSARCGAAPAPSSPRRRSPARPPPAGRRSTCRHRSRSRPTPPTSRRTSPRSAATPLTNNGFASAVTRGPLTALANSTSANGVYLYGGGGVFPTNTFQASNYWVDVVFDTTAADTTPPTRDRPHAGAQRDRRGDHDLGHRDLQRAGHAGEHRLHAHRSRRCRRRPASGTTRRRRPPR